MNQNRSQDVCTFFFLMVYNSAKRSISAFLQFYREFHSAALSRRDILGIKIFANVWQMIWTVFKEFFHKLCFFPEHMEQFKSIKCKAAYVFTQNAYLVERCRVRAEVISGGTLSGPSETGKRTMIKYQPAKYTVRYNSKNLK